MGVEFDTPNNTRKNMECPYSMYLLAMPELAPWGLSYLQVILGGSIPPRANPAFLGWQLGSGSQTGRSGTLCCLRVMVPKLCLAWATGIKGGMEQVISPPN